MSDDFVYFGAEVVALPPKQRFLRVGRAHRCRFSGREIGAVETAFTSVKKGRRGLPAVWVGFDQNEPSAR